MKIIEEQEEKQRNGSNGEGMSNQGHSQLEKDINNPLSTHQFVQRMLAPSNRRHFKSRLKTF